MMKQYHKDKILISQMMQIFNEKYKKLLADNKEDKVTEIIITNIKNDVDKSPCRFINLPKSLKVFLYKLKIMKNFSMIQ